jgi:hypothetical protein
MANLAQFPGTVEQIEHTKNKITEFTNSVTDEQYPSALATKKALDKKASVTDLYPVGTVYIANSPDVSPADLFGGAWELFDKEFKSSSGDIDASNFELQNGTTFYLTSDTTTGFSYVRTGHSLRLKLNLKLGADVTDETFTFGKIKDLTSLGISGWDYNFNNAMMSCDGSNAVILSSLGRDGFLISGDVVGQNSGTAKAGGIAFLDVTIPVTKDYMLDDFCDRFYWKRTE